MGTLKLLFRQELPLHSAYRFLILTLPPHALFVQLYAAHCRKILPVRLHVKQYEVSELSRSTTNVVNPLMNHPQVITILMGAMFASSTRTRRGGSCLRDPLVTTSPLPFLTTSLRHHPVS